MLTVSKQESSKRSGLHGPRYLGNLCMIPTKRKDLRAEGVRENAERFDLTWDVPAKIWLSLTTVANYNIVWGVNMCN